MTIAETEDVMSTAALWRAAGEQVAVATVTEPWGSSPRPAGSKMAVTNDRDRVSVFLFGTRLSNVTRQLRARDPEVAFQMVAHAVPDWSGGTRIGEALATFNHNWAKRVLGQGAIVLLITDGLDRDGAHGLAENMDRLHRSCRRLVWLNPLLRWSGFEPKSQGIRAMLPHVDEFRPVHNLASLRALVDLLSRPMAAPSGRIERIAA